MSISERSPGLKSRPEDEFSFSIFNLKRRPRNPDRRTSFSRSLTKVVLKQTCAFLLPAHYMCECSMRRFFLLHARLLWALARLALFSATSDCQCECVCWARRYEQRGMSGRIFVCLPWMSELVEPHTSLSLHSSPSHSPLRL